MSCYSCYHCGDGECLLHKDYDLLSMGFAECKDYIYEPGTDERELFEGGTDADSDT